MKVYLVAPAGEVMGTGGLGKALFQAEHNLLLTSFADAHYQKRTDLLKQVPPPIQKRKVKEKS